MNWVVGNTFLTLVNGIGPGQTFWLYAAFNAVFILLTFWLVPETKGVTLEDIERKLMHGKKLRDIGA
jgi:SP family galactose:H+ symporter-like MFS transporter